jgi:DNA-binding NtrC family response regulator
VRRSVAAEIRRWLSGPEDPIQEKAIEEKRLALVISANRQTVSDAANLAPSEWKMLAAEDLAQAIDILRVREIAIALVDRDSPNWQFVVARLAAAPYRCAVILLSRSSTANLWHELTRLGGYEIVAKPIRRDCLAKVLNAAWSHWRSQQALFTR